MVSATAADLIAQPCVTKPKPIREVLTIDEATTLQDCAKRLHQHGIGVLVVTDAKGALAGIVSERDFLRVIATGDVENGIVQDVMTPREKIISVDLDTGVGKCMELMRQHQIRHLPVMGGESGLRAQEELQRIAQAAVERREASLNAFEAKLVDAFGQTHGSRLFADILNDPAAHVDDSRPLLARAAEAGVKLSYAKDKLEEAQEGVDAGSKDSVLGIVSIRDLLLSVTAMQAVPLLDWLNDERRSLIEERVGYSE
jgi:CBS domain-containing protein